VACASRLFDGVAVHRFADADALLAPYPRDASEALAGQTPLMAGMVRCHLRELNADA